MPSPAATAGTSGPRDHCLWASRHTATRGFTGSRSSPSSPTAPPDLLVRHSDNFIQPGWAPPRPGLHQARLARISGRDGRVLWDTLLQANTDSRNELDPPYPGFGDLDGDDALDIVLEVGSPHRLDHNYDAMVVSLRDGKLLWSHPLTPRHPWVVVADLDGDHRSEVLVDETSERFGNASVLQALDGRDGKARWTWRSNAEDSESPWVARWNALANFEGDGRQSVCLGLSRAKGPERLVILDAQGRETAQRDLPQVRISNLSTADLNGDGRDELLLFDGQRLHAWRQDLKEFWSWPSQTEQYHKIVPTSPGRASTVVLYPDEMALDGATGQPRWAGHAPLPYWGNPFRTWLLDSGDSTPPAASDQPEPRSRHDGLPQGAAHHGERDVQAAPRHSGAARPRPRRPALDAPAPLDPRPGP